MLVHCSGSTVRWIYNNYYYNYYYQDPPPPPKFYIEIVCLTGPMYYYYYYHIVFLFCCCCCRCYCRGALILTAVIIQYLGIQQHDLGRALAEKCFFVIASMLVLGRCCDRVKTKLRQRPFDVDLVSWNAVRRLKFLYRCALP